ncbi:capsular polysaccharide biosynthesis protein [Oceanimonas doudoroffii]|uniref:Beta-3-deoxy-D-manno-oct-2-ulosonic acid transferase n=1 Tax=Oceanimonas doudoroffii TaxID=84158 RepID=A0A233RFD1_9GAMM|nr:capsular polysaccharide biosynthesis protein [Oceanimonas doudoroffii]OXY82102.1 beta-3-deoxy-D-manno-oct-2-ulosonic acid transferase [Oceanimonas doudoroffii]
MLLTTSYGIWRQRRVLNALLAPHSLGLMPGNSPAAVVGWGMKPNTGRARNLAEWRALPFWQLEDGFVGYIGHPANGGHRLSLIVDEVGVYYDATCPNALEHMLQNLDWWNNGWQQRAETLRHDLVEHGITKYNCYAGNTLPTAVADRLNSARPRVLVIDQTKGDQSVRLGLASEASFTNMLAAARAENPSAQIIVRTHPDVLLGKKQGYLTHAAEPDVLLLADSVNPFALMAKVDRVYTVTSQLGFEALLAGKPVVCFGAPFYAGWGVTDDRITVPRRGEPRTVPQLLAAAYLRYCRYLDPVTGERCELEELLDLILAQRAPVPPVNELYAVGFSLWRRRFSPRFLRRYANKVTLVDRIPDNGVVPDSSVGAEKAMDSRPRLREDDVPSRNDKMGSGNDNNAVLVWGRKFEQQAAACSLPVWRMEDGFLRSVGLGSDLRRPGSLVIDPVGMYYDPRTPSAIEHYLKHHDFSALEIELGKRLLTYFREQSLTKYNVGTRRQLDWRAQAGGHPVILVPGQVDDDASVQLGSPFVAGNAALLKAVRAAHPDSFIVFKPHPDVVSGSRKGQVPESVLAACVDRVETEAGIVDCLNACDNVHVLTSLTGLEALVRGKPVTVWGQPFYAGWGLTTDIYPVSRRGRALSLPALIYATYAWYPTYVDYKTGLYSTPLRMARQLARERESQREPKSALLRLLHRRLRKARFLWEALTG